MTYQELWITEGKSSYKQLARKRDTLYFPIMKTDELTKRLASYPEVAAAYPFGSAAKGKDGPLSDIDLALLLRYDTDFSRTQLLICNICSDIQELFQREGDVKIINKSMTCRWCTRLSHSVA
ncbi:MAG: nucleotidyltransferase domain-containing protein [Candidatus Zixiibacteriota bacterium]